MGSPRVVFGLLFSTVISRRGPSSLRFDSLLSPLLGRDSVNRRCALHISPAKDQLGSVPGPGVFFVGLGNGSSNAGKLSVDGGCNRTSAGDDCGGKQSDEQRILDQILTVFVIHQVLARFELASATESRGSLIRRLRQCSIY
jgi:hypothetical protein